MQKQPFGLNKPIPTVVLFGSNSDVIKGTISLTVVMPDDHSFYAHAGLEVKAV